MTPPTTLFNDRGKPIANTAVVRSVGIKGQPVTTYFSYQTMVAFQIGNNRKVVIQNYWGPTTGKHLNATGGLREERVDEDTFRRLYDQQMLGDRDDSVPVPAKSFAARNLCPA